MPRTIYFSALAVALLLPASAPAQSRVKKSPHLPGRILENTLLFQPARASESWLLPPPRLKAEDVWLRTSDGTRIHAWWCPNFNSQRAVLYCHGNAGNLSNRGLAVAALMQWVGESVLIFDYPGYGKSEGSPSEPGCYAAADAAYAWLVKEQKLPPKRIILFGESLGGGVAVELATRRPHQALALVKTFTSVPDVVQHKPVLSASASLVDSRFDNLAKIGRCPGPVFIAHADLDRLIPVAHAQRLYAAAGQPKHIYIMKGYDHNDPLTKDCLSTLAHFLHQFSNKNGNMNPAAFD